jgi:tetratricopeptide (TPR) repeat protein
LKAKYASLLMREPSQAKRAIEMLEIVNAEMPNLNRSWLNLGMLYFEDQRFKDAIACVKHSALFDRHDWKPVLVLATYFEKIKRHEQAIVYYYRALEMQINSQSQYDMRAGKTYETPSTFQTISPTALWYGVKLEYPMGDICRKLSDLYKKTGDKVMSRNFKALENKEVVTQHDLTFSEARHDKNQIN